MDMQLVWSTLLPLTRVGNNLGYTVELEKLPESAGVYVFGRTWGKGKNTTFEALYVGKGDNVRSRVRGQLNNLRLMQHLRDAKQGSRFLVAGVIDTRRGQQLEKVLRLSEHALIRHFLSVGHDLVNKQGTRIKRHSVTSARRPKRDFVPSPIFLERR